ncbi:unnamed protein product [Microthlaspi erraticum]|uniref:NYN domain-containing protein n=1 Tax=Microthlaspi erraticum TaxID=1685480 RepID=A0A6D2HLX8_9BRAS|nr:unnamed protein product [Microthlaspi erraticum]
MGFYYAVSINAYGGLMNHTKDNLYKARILHKPQGEGDMAVDLIVKAHTRSPRNFMVIPKPGQDSELHRSVVDCTQGLDGGKPIIGGRRMGDTTPVMEDLSSLVSLFQGSERKGFVFWDVVKCPITTYANIETVGNDIRAALQRLGHHGCVEILAFGGDKLNQNRLKDKLYEAGIICTPLEYCEAAMDLYAESLFPGPLMVIPRPDLDSDLHRFLTRMKQIHHDVLSVKPPPDDEDSPQDDLFLQYAQLIIGCTDGLYGGKPIIRGRTRMEEDTHVIQDFSKPITFVKGETAGVFWNLEDFPFPDGWSPDAIYEKIESAFRDDGYELSNMLVWAYVDDKEGSWGGDF